MNRNESLRRNLSQALTEQQKVLSFIDGDGVVAIVSSVDTVIKYIPQSLPIPTIFHVLQRFTTFGDHSILIKRYSTFMCNNAR